MIKELLEQLVKFLKIVLVVVLIAAIADPHDTKNMLTGIVGSIEIIIGHPSLPKVHISK